MVGVVIVGVAVDDGAFSESSEASTVMSTEPSSPPLFHPLAPPKVESGIWPPVLTPTGNDLRVSWRRWPSKDMTEMEGAGSSVGERVEESTF